MNFDYKDLGKRIIEKFGCNENFAQSMNMSLTELSQKLTNNGVWEQSEICKEIQLLEIKIENVHQYFFKIKVQSFER